MSVLKHLGCIYTKCSRCPPWDSMHASTRTAASMHRCQGSYGQSGRHARWDVPLHCQQERHTKGCLEVPTGKNPEDSNLADSGTSSTFPLVTIGVVKNISRNTAKMCRSTITHVQYSFSYNSQIKCSWTDINMDISSCFGTWKSCPKFVCTLQLHPVYVENSS
jgi:hypothetical protein